MAFEPSWEKAILYTAYVYTFLLVQLLLPFCAFILRDGGTTGRMSQKRFPPKVILLLAASI
jgi:hypothetical protein